VAEDAKAILLLAVALIVEDKGKPPMQRRALLIGVALNHGVDIVRKIEVSFEKPQCCVEKFIQSILTFGVHEADK
jgi:hypothetical protein